MNIDTFVLLPQVKAVRTYSGLDKQGMESIAFDFYVEPDFELKTNEIASRIIPINNIYRLFISLLGEDETTKEIFEVFSKDIISSVVVAKNEHEVLTIMTNRFKYWSDLFKRSKGNGNYDEKWIRGFCGELWFLSNILIDKIGCDEAIKSWTGPEKANQDFVTYDKIFEIKTGLQQAKSVKISNDNQLSKEMHLVFIEMSKSSMVSKSSINLYDLILSIGERITSPSIHAEFNRKLLELELFPVENANEYNKYSYEFESITYFKVNDKFPFIDHKDVPNAVIKYSYELSLSDINEFVTSEGEIWS